MPLLSTYRRNRILLGTGSLICFCIFWWAGRFFGIPAYRAYQASLLQQPSIALTFVITAAAIAVCMALGLAITGIIDLHAGLFVAAVGLSALSFRGGPLRSVLQYAHSPAVYLRLCAELIVLFCILLAAWLAISRLWDALWRHPSASAQATPTPTRADTVIAVGTETLVMVLAMIILAQSQAKMQVIAAVGISAFAGALIGYLLVPLELGIAHWLPPLFVGLLGYISAYFKPDGFAIGEIATPNSGRVIVPMLVLLAVIFHQPISRAMLGLLGQDTTQKPGQQRPRAAISPLSLLLFAALAVVVLVIGWNIGGRSTDFAALARALPLDYASAGPAGAILGHWMAQQWTSEDEPDAAATHA